MRWLRLASIVVVLVGGLLPASFVRAQTEFIDVLRASLKAEPPAPAYFEYQAALASQRAMMASWKPRISLSAEFPGLTRQIEPILQDNGSQAFVPRSQSYMGAGLAITQPIPWTGGEIRIRSGMYRVQNFAPTPVVSWQSLPVMLSLYQPLDQGRPLLRQKQRTEMEVSLASRQASFADRAQLLEFATDWLEYESRVMEWESALAVLSRQDSLMTILHDLRQQGYLSVSQMAEAEMRTQSYQRAADQRWVATQVALTQLRYRWGQASELTIPFPQEAPPALSFTVDQLPDLINQHPDLYNSDLIEKELAWEMEDLRRQSRPSLQLVAGVGLNQSGASASEALSDPRTSQYLSMTMEYPILDWGQNRELRHGLTARMDAQQCRADLLFKQKYTQARQSMARLELSREAWIQLRQAVALAEESVEWHRMRFFQGDIELRQLFEMENELESIRQEERRQFVIMWQIWLELELLDPSW